MDRSSIDSTLRFPNRLVGPGNIVLIVTKVSESGALSTPPFVVSVKVAVQIVLSGNVTVAVSTVPAYVLFTSGVIGRVSPARKCRVMTRFLLANPTAGPKYKFTVFGIGGPPIRKGRSEYPALFRTDEAPRPNISPRRFCSVILNLR